MKDNSCIAVQCAIVQTCNHSIWVLKPIRMTSLCTAGITAHARERNPHPRRQKSPYQLQHEDILYRQSHWTALKKTKPKKKKQMSRIILLLLTTKCARLWRNHPSVPGYVRFFASYFSRGASSISLLYLCQHSGRDAASRVNDEQGDRWFLLSSGVMAPSLVSVIEPRLTDRHTNRMADLYIVARWRWPFAKWHTFFGMYQFFSPVK